MHSHTSAETIRFLEGEKFELTGHPPYSPDLASNDFYLFPRLSKCIYIDYINLPLVPLWWPYSEAERAAGNFRGAFPLFAELSPAARLPI
ncbi:hypothetical protein EVAR_9073_1 [Eumeta japonica]|uniref:Mariner Mos1 transposase n=1 Tax=Eumeta variegata TaxID=151549 RepID=A0A4C1TW23_EUMVA|nr:hypothetical protein EVAR_9073_1 [Eumeta japonica]